MIEAAALQKTMSEKTKERNREKPNGVICEFGFCEVCEYDIEIESKS